MKTRTWIVYVGFAALVSMSVCITHLHAAAVTPEQTASLRQQISDQGYRCDMVQDLNLYSSSARGTTFKLVCDQGRAFRLIFIDKQPMLIRPW